MCNPFRTTIVKNNKNILQKKLDSANLSFLRSCSVYISNEIRLLIDFLLTTLGFREKEVIKVFEKWSNTVQMNYILLGNYS